MENTKVINTGMIMDGIANDVKTVQQKDQAAKDAIENKQIMEAYARYKAAHTPRVRENKKIGRNDPCPCGSGKKYKNCCLSTGKYEKYKAVK